MDIRALAKGAALEGGDYHCDVAWLERFATLVRREALEEAAKVCDLLRHDEAGLGPYEYLGDCAAAIRALIEPASTTEG